MTELARDLYRYETDLWREIEADARDFEESFPPEEDPDGDLMADDLDELARGADPDPSPSPEEIPF